MSNVRSSLYLSANALSSQLFTVSWQLVMFSMSITTFSDRTSPFDSGSSSVLSTSTLKSGA